MKKLIEKIIALYQKGLSDIQVSQELLLTPGFVSYIHLLAKDKSAQLIYESLFSDVKESVLENNIMFLIKQGLMPYMIAFLSKTDIDVVELHMKNIRQSKLYQKELANYKNLKDMIYKEKPYFFINELKYLDEEGVDLLSLCPSAFKKSYEEYKVVKEVLASFLKSNGKLTSSMLSERFGISSNTVLNYLNIRDGRKLAKFILNEEDLKKLKSFMEKKPQAPRKSCLTEEEKKIYKQFKDNLYFWILMILNFHLTFEDVMNLLHLNAPKYIYKALWEYRDGRYKQALIYNFASPIPSIEIQRENFKKAKQYLVTLQILQNDDKRNHLLQLQAIDKEYSLLSNKAINELSLEEKRKLALYKIKYGLISSKKDAYLMETLTPYELKQLKNWEENSPKLCREFTDKVMKRGNENGYKKF